MAIAPALWNQLRFNTDQPPTISNLISQPAASRPGAIFLGPDTQQQFVYANSNTLELAQRLARRDVAKMREEAASPKPSAPNSAPGNHSPAPAYPQRPFQRPCKAAPSAVTQSKPKSADTVQAKPKSADSAPTKQRIAEVAEQRRVKQQEQLRKRREIEEADLKRRREAREKAATANVARNPAGTRVHQLQSMAYRNELPARGDSPPVRDTDPQLVEIREQHRELMGMLRELIRMKPPPSSKPQKRGPSQIARAIASSHSSRPRGYLSETHASKGRQQRPMRRRPCEEKRETPEEEIEERVIQPMRLLNAMPKENDLRQDAVRYSTSSLNRQAVLRDHLIKRLGTPSPSLSEQRSNVEDELSKLLVDEMVGNTTRKMEQVETHSIPGNNKCEKLLEPTVDELDFRLQQIESEYDEIRQRWGCIEYDDLPPVKSESAMGQDDGSLGPLVLENKAMLFTKRRGLHSDGLSATEKRRLLPRPPQHVPVGLSRATLRSIANGRQRYLDWVADRPGPRFSVDIATVADWLCADLVDEALNASVQDIEKASDDIVHLLLEGEMAGGDAEEEEDGSTSADDEEYADDANESSSFVSESDSASRTSQ